MKIFITTLLMAFGIYSHTQTNYYVSPYGNDSNSGSNIGQALQTIQKAADLLQAGDTVFIKTGIYNEIVIPANSGTAAQPITYIVYPGDTAVIDGSNFTNTYLQFYDRGIFDIKDKYYINVVGLTIQNSAGGGIMCRFGSSHINIEGNIIKNCNATGIGVGYSRESYPLATHINVYDNFIDNCSTLSRESISFRSVDTFKIYNNIVQNTPKEGIDAKSGCSNGEIYKNTVSNAAIGIYIDAGYTDPLYNSLHNIYVYKNTVINSKGAFAVASEEGCLGENIWFYNNIAYDTSPQAGNGITVANFGISGPLKNIYIINNTFHRKGHRGIYINNLNVSNIFIRNNIVSQNTIAQIDVKSALIDSVTLAYNLIDGTNVDDGDFAVIGSPSFIDANTGNFRLMESSLAIDKGTSIDAPNTDFDGSPRPSGSGFDIGAFEFTKPLSIKELSPLSNISIYPNPTQTSINVINNSKENLKGIVLTNHLGQYIKNLQEGYSNDLTQLSNGIYIICIEHKNGLKEFHKFIKR